MPGVTPVGADTVEIELLTAALGQTGVNILHYNVRNITNGGCTLQEIANSYDNLVQAAYKNAICNQATWRGVGATNLTGVRTTQFYSNVNNGIGTGGANMTPTQVRALISWYAGGAGPGNRGRTYIPFVPLNGVTASGDPLPAYITILTTLELILGGPIVVVVGTRTTTLDLMIYHRPPSVAPFSLVTRGVVRARFATQRRSGAYGRVNVPAF
jgi:hypothetical protein